MQRKNFKPCLTNLDVNYMKLENNKGFKSYRKEFKFSASIRQNFGHFCTQITFFFLKRFGKIERLEFRKVCFSV